MSAGVLRMVRGRIIFMAHAQVNGSLDPPRSKFFCLLWRLRRCFMVRRIVVGNGEADCRSVFFVTAFPCFGGDRGGGRLGVGLWQVSRLRTFSGEANRRCGFIFTSPWLSSALLSAVIFSLLISVSHNATPPPPPRSPPPPPDTHAHIHSLSFYIAAM